jgi:integrase
MARCNLTDRFIRSPSRVPSSDRVDFLDALVPNLALRVTHQGHRSFVLIARYPLNPRNPTRRALGDYGALTLDEARIKARRWIALIARGIDPKVQEAREKAAEQRKQTNTFAALWAEFDAHHVARLANAREARQAGAVFVRLWGGRPAVEIAPEEIAAAIRAKAKTAPGAARNHLGHLRRMYSWAIGAGGHGIAANPCAVLKPADLIGRKIIRDRTLTDDELRAIWRAADGLADIGGLNRRRAVSSDIAGRLNFPFGPMTRLLVLTGARLNEIARLSWAEIDFHKAMITIPASRMKSGAVHIIPLGPTALALLQSLPRFNGLYVFSTQAGQRPVSGFSAAKQRLDALSGVSDDWTFHDIRRTMRSHLSALPIEDRVREAMIAHAQPGLHRIYNLYDYMDEKRRGFALWEQRLQGILHPPPPNITNIAEVRQRRADA